MFVVDTELTVNFLLSNTNASFAYTDFDIRISKPNGDSLFVNSALTEEQFIAPTVDTTGAVSYPFTPDTEGVWVVVLSTGDSNAFQIYHEYFLRVSSPDIHILQQVDLG